MFVDASALCAVLLNEADRDVFRNRIAAAHEPISSPLAVFETAMAVKSKKAFSYSGALDRVEALLDVAGIKVVPITTEIGRFAVDAHSRYGKGTGHPAQLNMGDCFAYACARAHGVPLLYKGGDFVHTDLA